MKFELILTVSIVNFGFKCVKSHNQPDDKVVTDVVDDKGTIRENFQNLFESMAKNDGRKTELYHKALKEEAWKGKQAYDEMKDQLLFAQIRNSYKKMNPYPKNNENENIVPFKRNVIQSNKQGCEVGWGGKLESGKHSIDVTECIVWYCNYKEEMEDHRCKDLERYETTYPAFWRDCLENACF